MFAKRLANDFKRAGPQPLDINGVAVYVWTGQFICIVAR